MMMKTKKGFDLLCQAAEQGNADAQAALVSYYPQTDEQIIKWLSQAVSLGHEKVITEFLSNFEELEYSEEHVLSLALKVAKKIQD